MACGASWPTDQESRRSLGSCPVSCQVMTRRTQGWRQIASISASTLARGRRVLPRARVAASSSSFFPALAKGRRVVPGGRRELPARRQLLPPPREQPVDLPRLRRDPQRPPPAAPRPVHLVDRALGHMAGHPVDLRLTPDLPEREPHLPGLRPPQPPV